MKTATKTAPTMNPAPYSPAHPQATRKIVVLQRGWIVVGDVHQEGNNIVVNSASVIRRWGTTNGLGQLALGGATKDTILDPCGVVRAHELAVVMTIDVQFGINNQPMI